MLVRPTQALALLLCLAIHSLTQAQEGPPSAEYLQPIESFIGVWEARFDPPGPVPEGDLEIQFRWMGNKSYVQTSVEFHPDGAPEHVHMNPEFTVIGYSKQEETTKAWLFKYTSQGRTDAIVERDRLVIQQQEGKEGESNFRQQIKIYELKDPDTMIITETSQELGATPNNQPPLELQRSLEKVEGKR